MYPITLQLGLSLIGIGHNGAPRLFSLIVDGNDLVLSGLGLTLVGDELELS